LFTIVIFCCSFVLMSFSDDLKFKFTSNMDNSNNSIFILNDSDVKERIISEYSQQYYEKLLDVGNIFSSIHYDSIQNYFYVYAWKNHMLKQIKKLTAPDIENGVIWLTRSAEQGDINAQCSLAVFYYEKGNIEEAKKWFRLTAEQGDDIHILYDIY
jgi:TPR repeat protein